MCIYPTVSTEQMSMIFFFICLFVGFTFVWLGLSYCFVFLFVSVFLLLLGFLFFFTGGLFHKGGIQIIRTRRKGWRTPGILVHSGCQSKI